MLNWDVRRLLLSLAANTYVRLLSGLECFDCTSGFRGYRASVLGRVPLDQDENDGLRVPSGAVVQSWSRPRHRGADLLYGAAPWRIEDVERRDRGGTRAPVGPLRAQARAAAPTAVVNRENIDLHLRQGRALLRFSRGGDAAAPSPVRRRDHRQRRFQHRRHLRGHSRHRSEDQDSPLATGISPNPDTWHRDFKNKARELCTGDWCILLDCDEFIPEWEFDRLRAYLATTDDTIVPVKFVHFYGNYKVYLAELPQIIPLTGTRIHRNLAGDRSLGRRRERALSRSGIRRGHGRAGRVRRASLRDGAESRPPAAEMADAGDASTTRRIHDGTRFRRFVFNMFPHRGTIRFSRKLAIYEPPDIKAVRDDPAEFTRDDFWLYEHLKRQPSAGAGPR